MGKAEVKTTPSIAGNPVQTECSKTIHNWFATWKEVNKVQPPNTTAHQNKFQMKKKINSLKHKFIKLKQIMRILDSIFSSDILTFKIATKMIRNLNFFDYVKKLNFCRSKMLL